MQAIITLEDGKLPHVAVTDGPLERTYDTTPEMLADLFLDGDGGNQTWSVSPILPPHTVFWGHRAEEDALVLDLPAGPQPWTVPTRSGVLDAHVIPMPRLLFWFQRRQARIVRTALVALADDAPLTPDTPLFAYPFSNVYPDTTCCWHLPDQRTPLDALPGLARAFFATPNNWDLYPANSGSGLDYRALIAALETRSTFPQEWLQPLSLTWTTWIARLAPSSPPPAPGEDVSHG